MKVFGEVLTLEREKYIVEIRTKAHGSPKYVKIEFIDKNTQKSYPIIYPSNIQNLEKVIEYFEQNENLLEELKQILLYKYGYYLIDRHIGFISNTIKKIVETNSQKLIKKIKSLLEFEDKRFKMRNEFKDVFNVFSELNYHIKEIDNNKIIIINPERYNYNHYFLIISIGNINTIKFTKNASVVYDIIFNNKIKALNKIKTLKLSALPDDLKNTLLIAIKGIIFDLDEKTKNLFMSNLTLNLL